MKVATLTVVILTALVLWSSFTPLSAQPMRDPILVIEGAPGTYSYGKVTRALEGMRYKGKVAVVNSEEDLNRLWAERDNYRILWIGYHAFRDNEWLRNWFTGHQYELEAWVREGGTVLATIKDVEDEPLAYLFGLSKYQLPPEVDEIPLTPGTPFATDVPDLKLSSQDGFCVWVFSEPLPEWVEYVVATKDGAPAIVAGKYGKGCLILGTAEWVDTTAAYMPGTDDWDPFWRNVFNWIYATAERPTPPPEFYTKAEVDALIEEAIETAVARAIAEVPPPTTAMALGAGGLVLGLIAIALAVMALRRK